VSARILDGRAVAAEIRESVLPDVHALAGWAIEHDVDPGGLTVTRPSLEEIYLRLTGEAGGGQ